MVSARSVSSSAGPGMASRSCRLSSEIRCVATVISRSGRSTRPATIQPSTSDATVMMASATADPTISECDTAAWMFAASADGRVPPRAAEFALATCETDAPTLPVITSSTAPDSRNSTLYRTVSRARTLRRGSTRRPGSRAPGAVIVASCALIIASRGARSRRPGARLPWAAPPSRPPGCPAGPNNDITAGVRPVLGPLPYNRAYGHNYRSQLPAQAVRAHAGPGRDDLHRAAGPGDRVRRPQRRGQVHHDAGDPGPGRPGRGHRAGRRAAVPGPAPAVAPGRLRSEEHTS